MRRFSAKLLHQLFIWYLEVWVLVCVCVCVCVCVEEERGWSGGWGGAEVRVVEREGNRGGAIFVDRWLYYLWPNLNCGQIKHRDELGLEASAEGGSTSQLEMWEAAGSARPTLTGPLRDGRRHLPSCCFHAPD